MNLPVHSSTFELQKQSAKEGHDTEPSGIVALIEKAKAHHSIYSFPFEFRCVFVSASETCGKRDGSNARYCQRGRLSSGC